MIYSIDTINMQIIKNTMHVNNFLIVNIARCRSSNEMQLINIYYSAIVRLLCTKNQSKEVTTITVNDNIAHENINRIFVQHLENCIIA